MKVGEMPFWMCWGDSNTVFSDRGLQALFKQICAK